MYGFWCDVCFASRTNSWLGGRTANCQQVTFKAISTRKRESWPRPLYAQSLPKSLNAIAISFACSCHSFCTFLSSILKIVFLHIPVLIPIPPLAISSQWAEETKYGDMAFIPMRVSANMIDTNSFRWAHLHNIWRVHLWCDAGHWRRSSNQSSGGE